MTWRLSDFAGYVVSAEQVSCDLAGESVILNLKSGVYFGLDDVGAQIWRLLQERRAPDEIRDLLLKQYAVDPNRCERDLAQLLQQMAAAGLIEVKNALAS